MRLGFFYTIAGLIFLAFSIEAAPSLESCGAVVSVKGETCDQISIELDLTSCENGVGKVIPKTKCEGDKVIALHKTKSANYRAIFESKTLGWGKKSFQLQGKIWRHLKPRKHERETASEVSPPVPPPAPVPPTLAAPSPVPQSPVPQSSSKVKREDEIDSMLKLFSGLNIKGSVDFYYAVNSNAPAALTGTPSVASPLVQNKYHVFDTYHDDLQLNFARLQIQKSIDEVTTTLDFGYGPAMQMISGGKTDSSQLNLKQAIIGYKPTDRLTIEVGRFVTFLGFELIETQDNWNYSRGLLFGYFVPFWHQGVKATYSLSDTVSVMGAVVNGWNNSYDDNHQRSIGGQVAWVPSPNGSLYLNAISGPDVVPGNVSPDNLTEIKSVVDIVGTYKPTENLSLGLNIDFLKHQKSATGVAAFLRYQLDEKWALASRVEIVEDKENLAMGETFEGGQNLSSYTVTIEKKLTPNLLWRAEGRFDSSNRDTFIKDNEGRKNQTIGILGITASF